MARIVGLIALFALVGSLSGAYAEEGFRAGTGRPYEPWPIWVALVPSAGALVAVALLGRERHHPPATLAMEGLLAAVLGLIPPIQWFRWFGVNAFVEAAGFHQSDVTFLQPLAIAWLVIVGVTAVRQVRRRNVGS